MTQKLKIFTICAVVLCVLKFGQTIDIKCSEINDFGNFGSTCLLDDLNISNENKDSYNIHSDPKNAEVLTIMIGSSTLDHIPGDFKKAFPKFDKLSLTTSSITSANGKFFKEAEHLKTLHFDEGKLQGLNSEFFAPLKNLENLKIENSKLENLTSFSNLFSNNKKLQKITLENNEIDSINPKIFDNLNLLNIEISEYCAKANLTQASIKNLTSMIKNCSDNYYFKEIDNLQLQISELSKKIEDVKQSLPEEVEKEVKKELEKTDEKIQETNDQVQENTKLLQTIGKMLNKNSTNSVEKDVEAFVEDVEHLKTMSGKLDEESRSLLEIASNQQIILYCLIAVSVVVLIEFLMLLFRK